MPHIRFPRQQVWRDVVFKEGVVYQVGPRIAYKFAQLQGLAELIADDSLDAVGAEEIPDPGQEKVPVKSEPEQVSPPPEPEPELTPPEPVVVSGVKLEHRGGPWYDVIVDGRVYNESSLRRGEAEELAKKLEANAAAQSSSTVSGQTPD